MNLLESTITANPAGSEEECAKFTIDDTSIPFVFSSITSPGKQYTLTIWVRADSASSMLAAGESLTVSPMWEEKIVTYTATGTDLLFYFQNTGTYYIYHSQLEVGNVSTDWAPAPEDTNDDVGSLRQDVTVVRESVSQLTVEADGISTRVGVTESKIDEVTGELTTTKEEFSQLKQEQNKFVADITTKITEEGVEKVVTTTGTFDETGLTIDNSESPTKTQVTPNGMTVKRKTGGSEENVLTATSEGVEATNLHAKTYLIVGGRSRFENYWNNRTGCFWTGDD